jgi:hypothetical protein
MTTLTDTTSRAVPEAHRLDGLLAPAGPPRRAGALAASATFGWRAILKIKHEPKQLTEVIAIPVLITVLFTYIFGGAISGSPGHYLTILLPGTLVMGIAIVTMYGGARLARDVTTGAFDRCQPHQPRGRRGPGPDEQHQRSRRPGRLVAHRDRGHHPCVRAAHPPPLQQARLTRTGRPMRQCRRHHGAAPPRRDQR